MRNNDRIRNEIGSEFWDVPISLTENSLFPVDTKWFLSGRSALQHILREIKSKNEICSAALPAWCCDSMILPFLEAGIEVKFYPVYVENGQLIQDITPAAGCDIFFSMEYFGYTGAEFHGSYPGIVIRDLTHSIFSNTLYPCRDDEYCFGSLRKWAGFLTGGYAFLGVSHSLPMDSRYGAMRRLAMEMKADYIAGRTSDKEYLKLFNGAEEYLDHCPPAGADPSDVEKAQVMDVAFIKEQRRKNAAVLLDALADMAIFPRLNESDCPMFVPVLVPKDKRDELRRYLIQKEIYCPVHWPLTQLHHPDEQTMKIYTSELSIVCDQRYDENDMERIIEAIRAF